MTQPAEAPPAKRRDRPFAAYLGVQGSWFAGFGMQMTLFPYVVRRLLDASEPQLGYAQMALTAPSILLMLFGGVIADRAEKRYVLMALHLLAFVPCFGMAVLIWTDSLSYALLIVYALAMGCIGAIMMPTRDAALNAVADLSPGDLTVQKAVVLASLVQFVAQVGGMVLVMVAAEARPAWLMAAMALIFSLGAIAAFKLPALKTPKTGGPDKALRQIEEGLKVVWASPVIRAMALIMVGTGIFVIGAGILVLLPLVVLDVYQAGLAAMSQVMITFWVGAAVATVALARFGHVERPGRTLVAAIGLGVASIAFLAFEIPFWSLYVLVFIWGLSGGVSIAMSRTIVQQHAPPEALARVLSIYQLGFMGGAPIGAVAVGYIVAFSDVRTAALFPLVGMAISLVWLAVFTPIFKLSDDSRK